MKIVAVIPNINKDVSLSLTKKIVELLSACATVRLSDEFKATGIDAEYVSGDDIFEAADFAVTVGGDGTILGIAEKASEKGISVIGVNLGKMGFMAELEPDEINLLLNVFDKEINIEKRMMLDVSIIRDGEKIFSARALNDVVVSRNLEKL